MPGMPTPWPGSRLTRPTWLPPAPASEGYLSRVPKALILDAVRDGAGPSAAARIAGTKKEVMAADAAALLAGTGWLPAMLHVPVVTYPVDPGAAGDQAAAPVAMAAE